MSRGRKLCHLALCGGGTRGIAEAVILHIIMNEVNIQLGLEPGTLVVADVFDLIGGTSTVGLLAMMCGLRIPTKVAIEQYKSLSEELFGSGNKQNPLTKPDARYDATPISKRVKSLLHSQGLSPEMPMEELETVVGDWNNLRQDKSRRTSARADYNATGKAFVTTSLAVDVNHPICLRGYSGASTNTESTMYNAARATSAAPPVLDPVEVLLGGISAQGFDAGMLANNPSIELMVESNRLWKRKREVGLFLCLGTGPKPANSSIERPDAAWFSRVRHLLGILPTVIDAALDVDGPDTVMEMYFGDTDTYFMIDIPNIGNFDMTDASNHAISSIVALTNAYMAKKGQRTLLTITKILVRSWCELNQHRSEAQAWLGDPHNAELEDLQALRPFYKDTTDRHVPRAPVVVPTSGQLSQVSQSTASHRSTRSMVGTHFTGYVTEVKQLVDFLLGSDGPARFLVYGMPGVGKTELARAVLSNETLYKRYTYVFWVDLTDGNTETESLRRIVTDLELQIACSDLHELRSKVLAAIDTIPNGPRSWMMVLDDAQTESDIYLMYAVQAAANHLLVTSRNWDLIMSFRGGLDVMELKELLPEHALQLLQRSMRRQALRPGDTDDNELDRLGLATRVQMTKIVKQLSHHPLAIDLVGSVFKRRTSDVSRFEGAFITERKKWLAKKGFVGLNGYRKSLYVVLDKILACAMSVQDDDDDVQKEARPMMQKLLQFIAVLDFKAVHEDIIPRANSNIKLRQAPVWANGQQCFEYQRDLSPELMPLAPLFYEHRGKWSPDVTTECIALLYSAGLLLPSEINPLKDALNVWCMHPLIRFWAIDSMSDSQYNEIMTFAAWMVSTTISVDGQTYDDFRWRATMHEHVLSLVDQANERGLTSKLDAGTLWRFERVYTDCGDLVSAPALAQAAIDAESDTNTTSGTEKDFTARYRVCMNSRKSGKYSEAKKQAEELLASITKAKERFDLETFGKLNAQLRRELATVLMRLGELPEASAMIESISDYIDMVKISDTSIYKLTLHELQAEVAEDAERMRSVSKKMHSELGENHPYTIRTRSKAALLLHEDTQHLDDAIAQCQQAYALSVRYYGQKYAGTIHARVALARCLIKRRTATDLIQAGQHLDSVDLTNTKMRFGENATETLEWRFQSILLAFVTPVDVGPEVRRQAKDDLRAIIGCLERTHGKSHSMTLRMSALLVQFVALFSIQEAYAQLADLKQRAAKCFSNGHPQLQNLTAIEQSLDAIIASRKLTLPTRGPAPATIPPPPPASASSSRNPAAEASGSRSMRALRAFVGSSGRKADPGHFEVTLQQEGPVPLSPGRQRRVEEGRPVPPSPSRASGSGTGRRRGLDSQESGGSSSGRHDPRGSGGSSSSRRDPQGSEGSSSSRRDPQGSGGSSSGRRDPPGSGTSSSGRRR